MISALADREFEKVGKGDRPLDSAAVKKLADALQGGWQIVDGKILRKLYEFKNFKQALEFTNLVGELAENAKHHPDILLAWGKSEISLTTHSVGGLSINDFILAARIDRL